jgi:hypothetical protein
MKIFGREPVYILGFLSAALQASTAFGFDVSPEMQTLVNALAASAVAVISAIVLRNGAVAAAVLGFAQAAMALVVGLGLDWSTEDQGKWMAFVAAVLALWLREKVTAPVSVVPLEQRSPVADRYGQVA